MLDNQNTVQQLINEVNLLRTQLDAIANSVSAIEGSNALALEIINRSNADNALDDRIDQEITDRSNADNALSNSKANLNGNPLIKFKAANGTDNDDVVNLGQLNQVATTTLAGLVEKATQVELNTGVANVWPDAATILKGFSQSSDSFKLPEFLGGWKIKWGHTFLGDDAPATAHKTTITGFTEIKTVLVGSTTTDNYGAFVYHRQSFDNNSVTVVFDEWVSQIQNGLGYWWFAIGY